MAEPAEEVPLAELTTQIVSAYIAHHHLGTAELAGLISAVAGQLGRIGSKPQASAAEGKPAPAVPVRRSIKPDHLVCLVCGGRHNLLKRHLAVEHDLNPDQYRRTFELPPDYPMAAPNYTQQRRELALDIGLGRPKKPVRKARKSIDRRGRPQRSQPEVAGASSDTGRA